jgi:hypothetical protein
LKRTNSLSQYDSRFGEVFAGASQAVGCSRAVLIFCVVGCYRAWTGDKPIFAAAKKAGVEQYYVEQEPPFTEMPAMEAIRIDYDFLHKLQA